MRGTCVLSRHTFCPISPKLANTRNHAIVTSLPQFTERQPMINILFVCHGNICRSPMAEFVMKERVRQSGLDAAVYVESAAMHRDEIGSDVH